MSVRTMYRSFSNTFIYVMFSLCMSYTTVIYAFIGDGSHHKNIFRFQSETDEGKKLGNNSLYTLYSTQFNFVYGKAYFLIRIWFV